jgi:hypothetical protein
VKHGLPLGQEMVDRIQKLNRKNKKMLHFWRFLHNALIHPLLAFPYEPEWVTKLHDWSANKIILNGGEYI